MKAIQTRYHGATNHKGARIVAMADGVKNLTMSYPYELSGAAVHAAAAVALCKRMNWDYGRLVSGVLPNGDYVFCFSDSDQFEIK